MEDTSAVFDSSRQSYTVSPNFLNIVVSIFKSWFLIIYQSSAKLSIQVLGHRFIRTNCMDNKPKEKEVDCFKKCDSIIKECILNGEDVSFCGNRFNRCLSECAFISFTDHVILSIKANFNKNLGYFFLRSSFL